MDSDLISRRTRRSVLVGGGVLLAGFGFAKYHFKGRDTVFLAVLSSMMVPFFVLLIPVYYIVKELGWLDTYQGLIVPNLVTGFGVFLMRQFIMTIPDEFIDAARVDGAAHIRHPQDGRSGAPVMQNLSRSALITPAWSELHPRDA